MNAKSIYIFLFLLIASTAIGAENAEKSADESFSFSGQLFHGTYLRENKPLKDNYLLSRTSLWPKVSKDINKSSYVLAELTIDMKHTEDLASANNTVNSTSVGIREAYHSYSKDSWQAKSGHQVINWGNSDLINPTDVFGAKDGTFLHTVEGFRRRGVTAGNFTWTPDAGNSPWSFQFIVSPTGPRSTLLIPAITLPTGVSEVTVAEKGVGQLSAGTRIQNIGEGWDFSLVAYSGLSHIPEMQLVTSSGGTYEVARVHQRLVSYGGDFSITFGEFIFRTEAAMKIYSANKGDTQALTPNYFEGVLGIEKPFGEHFRTHFQAITRSASRRQDVHSVSTPDPTKTALLKSLMVYNERISGLKNESEFGGTGRLTWDIILEKWSVELFHLQLMHSESSVSRALTRFKGWGDIEYTLGGEFYSGKSDTTLGSLSVFDSLIFELSTAF